MNDDNRPLTDDERQLVRWMLDHGEPGAIAFLDQLDAAEVKPWRCPCGCASLRFAIRGRAEPGPGVHPISDYLFGEGGEVNGIFVYENQGTLIGVEVYGLSGDAPKSLPIPSMLRQMQSP